MAGFVVAVTVLQASCAVLVGVVDSTSYSHSEGWSDMGLMCKVDKHAVCVFHPTTAVAHRVLFSSTTIYSLDELGLQQTFTTGTVARPAVSLHIKPHPIV